MPRHEIRSNRGRFSLQYALLFVTVACIILGSACIARFGSVPDWALPLCGVGILGGFYGLMALVVFQFIGD